MSAGCQNGVCAFSLLVTNQNPTHTFAKAHDKSCLLVAIATTFAHILGGDSIRAPQNKKTATYMQA